MDKYSIERLLNVTLSSFQPLSGGNVSHAAYIRTTSGSDWVIKQNPTALSGIFDAEADGLERIRATGAIRAPEVVRVSDGDDIPAGKRYIMMQFIGGEESNPVPSFGQKFGEQLARMHAAAPSPNGQYGLDRDNFLGRRPQRNPWAADFAEFYRDQRILPVMTTTRSKMPSGLNARLDKLIAHIPELLDGMPQRPCLIHGDLWSGNFLAADGEPVLIDPAVYYGHPEIEWAYIELFGGFPSGMREGYDSVLPLDGGYSRRKSLLQLYHLLVHVDHFGGPYVSAVERVCAAYGV